MLVVKTTSPNAGSMRRVAEPENQVPSSSKTKAGRPVIGSPRDLKTGSLFGLGRRWRRRGRLGRRLLRRSLWRWRRLLLTAGCGQGGRGARQLDRRGRGARTQPLLERAAAPAPRHELKNERQRQEDGAAPPGGLGQNRDRLPAAKNGLGGSAAAAKRCESPALSGLQQDDDGQEQRVENQQHQQEVKHASTRVRATQDSGAARPHQRSYALMPTISAHPSGVRLAPPTSTPSRSGSARSASALPAFTLPPYRTDTRPGHRCRARYARMKRWTSAASRGVAFRPVPMAQTGS